MRRRASRSAVMGSIGNGVGRSGIRVPERGLGGCRGRDEAEVAVGGGGRDASSRGALKEAELEEERLVDVHDRVGLLARRGGNGLEANGSSAELLDDAVEDGAVGVVEAEGVDVEEGEGGAGGGEG